MDQRPLSGRQGEALRNDERILEAARAVFLADPGAPISAVAEEAGVGMSALYRRYGSKEELLRTLCAEGLKRYINEVEAALADHRAPWTVFAEFMGRVVDAETHSLTQRLAGSFEPTEEMFRDARRAEELDEELITRSIDAGALRPDVTPTDIAVAFEMVAAIRFGDGARTAQAHRRYLTLLLDGLRTPTTSLPVNPPSWRELRARWQR